MRFIFILNICYFLFSIEFVQAKNSFGITYEQVRNTETKITRITKYNELKMKILDIVKTEFLGAEIEGIILLLGGHKDTQSKDIANAKALLEGIKNGKVRTQTYE